MSEKGPDFNLYMLPAENGDCLWVEYESAQTRKRILIDCGTEGSWPELEKRILKLPEGERHFDLVVITHIDDDHLGGALPMIKYRHALGLTFGEIWFNDLDHIVATGLGVGEGVVLSKLLAGDEILRKVWNSSVDQQAVHIPVLKPGQKLPMFSFGELDLTILSPTSRQLSRLKDKWLQVVAELNAKKAKQPNLTHRAEKWLGASTIRTAAASRASLDRSVANGSSIAFLATYRGTSFLFGADAFAPTLLKSLAKVQPSPSTICFKLSHHGSFANLTEPLLKAIGASHYLISTSGAMHGHPHTATLDMLTKGDAMKTLHLNYRAEHVVEWIANHPAGAGRNYEIRYIEESGYRVSL